MQISYTPSCHIFYKYDIILLDRDWVDNIKDEVLIYSNLTGINIPKIENFL